MTVLTDPRDELIGIERAIVAANRAGDSATAARLGKTHERLNGERLRHAHYCRSNVGIPQNIEEKNL